MCRMLLFQCEMDRLLIPILLGAKLKSVIFLIIAICMEGKLVGMFREKCQGG